MNIEDVEITTGGSLSAQTGIMIDACEKVRLRGVKVDGIPGKGIEVRISAGVLVDDCELRNTGLSASIGIDISEASVHCRVRDCRISEPGIGVAVGSIPATGVDGVCRHNQVRGCFIEGAATYGVHIEAHSR